MMECFFGVVVSGVYFMSKALLHGCLLDSAVKLLQKCMDREDAEARFNFLSRRPTLSAVHRYRPDDCSIDLRLQVLWYLPIAEHTSHRTPLGPSCTHAQSVTYDVLRGVRRRVADVTQRASEFRTCVIDVVKASVRVQMRCHRRRSTRVLSSEDMSPMPRKGGFRRDVTDVAKGLSGLRRRVKGVGPGTPDSHDVSTMSRKARPA
ncbi:unnamed protein product [Heligmosomoides polygyrus]|uniref:HORMA domain-containing protein n=1 Tax=Heligmosomoides polygyrus TaxID=6339 RepID=A0A183FM07_HELPZ|nr:unnamed protein product [Heligmosomoides polygyrus]